MREKKSTTIATTRAVYILQLATTYYWSMINIRDRKIDRRGRTTTKIYIQYIFTLFCYHIGPVFKVSNLNDESINSSCVVGPPHVIILVSIPAPIAWNLLKHFIEFPNIIINTKSLTAHQRGIFLILTDISREDPSVSPEKAISYTFRCVFTLQ